MIETTETFFLNFIPHDQYSFSSSSIFYMNILYNCIYIYYITYTSLTDCLGFAFSVRNAIQQQDSFQWIVGHILDPQPHTVWVPDAFQKVFRPSALTKKYVFYSLILTPISYIIVMYYRIVIVLVIYSEMSIFTLYSISQGSTYIILTLLRDKP